MYLIKVFYRAFLLSNLERRSWEWENWDTKGERMGLNGDYGCGGYVTESNFETGHVGR